MRHSRGDTKSDAKNSSIPRIRPRFYNRVRSPQSGLFPALSPAAHRHGSYVSVCEGSERQQGGQLTYTLHSFRFCAESVYTAVDRAGSTATCVPQSTRRRRGFVAQNARPASEVPAAAPRERAPHDLRHTVVSHITCTQAVWGKIPREEVLLVADSGQALEITSRPRRPAPARPQATVVSRRRAERGSGLRARVAAE